MTPLPRLPRGLLLSLGLIAASLLLSGDNLSSPPIWDDHHFVVEQPFLQDPVNLFEALDPRHLVQVLPVTNAARPVWLASVLLDRALFGPSFTALKVSNALWHGLGAALLALLAWELTASAAVAVAAGALFVVHPLHGEVVGIVTFRADSIAFVFMMLALVFHLRARRTQASLGWRLSSFAAFSLALLAKESATALPFLLPIVEWAAPQAQDGRTFSRPRVYAAFALLLLGYAYFRIPRSGYVTRDGADAFTLWHTSHPGLFAPISMTHPPSSKIAPALAVEPRDPPPWSAEMSDPATRVRTMIAINAGSLWRLVWPQSFQGDFAPRIVRSWADPRLIAGVFAWMGLLGAVIVLRRRQPLLAASLAWTAAAMIPTCGVILMRNLSADRYLYTASAGVCLAVASLGRQARLLIVLELAAVWLVIGASHRKAYHDDLSFFTATVRSSPDVPRARLNLAIAQSAYGRVEEAKLNYEEALRLWPGSRRAAEEVQRLSTTIAPPMPPPAHAASIP